MSRVCVSMAAAIMLWGAFGEAQAATRPQVTALGTRLADAGGTALGFAGSQTIVRNGTTTQLFEVVLCNLSQPAGTTLNVVVNGVQVGTTTTTANRGGTGSKARLLLNSARGATLPTIAPNDSIAVQTSDGVVIASGTFVRFR